jgi:hypothetical protein
MKKLISISVMLSLMTFAGTSFASIIPDTYLHPLDGTYDGNFYQRPVDVIGDPVYYQVSGHEWSSATKLTKLKIYTVPNSLVVAGDVFLSYSGSTGHDPLAFNSESWNLAVALRDHNFDPEKTDGFTAGAIFFPTSGRLADAYFSWADTAQYGDGELVTASGIDSEKDATIVYEDNYILIDFSGTDYTFDPWTRIRFTQTCGNDVIVSNPVPEPATILLLGSGLIALGGLARRRFHKRQL